MGQGTGYGFGRHQEVLEAGYGLLGQQTRVFPGSFDEQGL